MNRYPLEWSYELIPGTSWHADFIQNFRSLDISIRGNEEDGFLFASSHLNGLTDPQQVVDRAHALKTLFDGAMFIAYPGLYKPWKLGKLINIRDGVFPATREAQPGLSPWSPDAERWQWHSEDPSNPLGHPVGQPLFLARFDNVTRNVLEFLGRNGVTWVSLYATMEFMEHEGWDRNRIVKESGSTLKEMTRFTHTANNYAALGTEGRHGPSSNSPPKKPMSLDEARNLIIPTVAAFLAERARIFRVDDLWRAGFASRKDPAESSSNDEAKGASASADHVVLTGETGMTPVDSEQGK